MFRFCITVRIAYLNSSFPITFFFVVVWSFTWAQNTLTSVELDRKSEYNQKTTESIELNRKKSRYWFDEVYQTQMIIWKPTYKNIKTMCHKLNAIIKSQTINESAIWNGIFWAKPKKYWISFWMDGNSQYQSIVATISNFIAIN